MGIKVQSQNLKDSSLDKFKWALVTLLVVAGIVANQYFSDQPLTIRLIGWLILTCVVAGIAAQTAQGRKAWDFLQETRTELRKVVWSSRQETLQTTLFVLVIVAIMSLILWGIDSILLWAVSYFTGTMG